MSSVVVAVDRLSITVCFDCSNHTTRLLARSIDPSDVMGAVLGWLDLAVVTSCGSGVPRCMVLVVSLVLVSCCAHSFNARSTSLVASSRS